MATPQGSPTAPVLGGATPMDIPAMLCAQPPMSRWCKQEDVERDLGIEQKGISSFFEVVGRGSGGMKRREEVATQLAAAGVYRVLGDRVPKRVWWLAFAGKGGKQPRFAERGEDNSFVREGAGAGQETAVEPRTAVVAGDQGGSASGIARQEGDNGEDTAGEPSGGCAGDRSTLMGRRVAWVQSDALQLMMSKSTHGIFLHLGELSRFLDVAADGLREVLQPVGPARFGDHQMFLKMFGIFRDTHNNKPCWNLLGRGHLFTLGFEECTSLLSATFHPTFWTAMPWRPAAPPHTENGLGELQASEVLDISRLGEEISGSLQCRNCEPNCPRNPPRHKWEYMRVESQEMATPATPGELRVKFECANCESIHIAETLPANGLSPGARCWSMADVAVQWVFGSVHVHRSRATLTPRRANRITAGASETRAPDSTTNY